jgi:N-acetyl-anhydromuramyl-L-alanine amidase AmpD
MMPRFLQARHYRKVPPETPRRIDLVVIHSAEIGESLEGAEALMKACAVSPRVASWHYAVDAQSITQSVLEEDVAFAAPGANSNGIQIELCGYARQSQAEWQDAYSFHMLELAARLVADIIARHELPAVFVSRETLRLPMARGITTHAEVSKAFKKSSHWDPGPHFPMAHFIERVKWFGAPDTEPAPARFIETDEPGGEA